MRKLLATLATVVMIGVPAGVHAQVAWDAPLLLPPRPAPGFGIFLTDMSGGGLGVMGTWRSSTWNYGLRLGIAESAGEEDLAVFGGVDYSGPLHTRSADFPLDLDWVLGAGFSISDGVRLSVPLGLTAGYAFEGESARLTPYLTPRVVLDAFFGSDLPRDDLDLDIALDLGLDLQLTRAGGPLGGTTIRFAGTLGDRSALAIGLVF